MEGNFIYHITESYEYNEWASSELSEKVYGTGPTKARGQGGKCFVSISIGCDSVSEYKKDLELLSDPEAQKLLTTQGELVKGLASKMVKIGDIQVFIEVKPISNTPQEPPKPANPEPKPSTNTPGPPSSKRKIDVNTLEGFEEALSEYLCQLEWKVSDYGFSKKVGIDWWNINPDRTLKSPSGVISKPDKTKIYENDPNFPDTFHQIIKKCNDICNEYRI